MAVEKTILTKFKLDAKQFDKGVKNSGNLVADFAKGTAVFAAAGSVAGAALLAIAKSTAKFQDAQIKAGRTVGTTAKEFTALSFAADLAAVGQENLVKSLAKLNAPTAAVKKELKSLGVETKTAAGAQRDSSEVLNDLADAFKNLDRPVERSAAAFKLFGARGVELVNFLKDGSSGIKDLKRQAQELGLTFSEVAGERAEAFNDNLVKLTAGFTGLKNSIGEVTIEFINESGAVSAITDLLKNATGWVKNLSDTNKNFIGNLTLLTTAMLGVSAVLVGVIAALPLLKAGLSALFGPIGIVVNLLAAAAVVAIKLASKIPTVGDTYVELAGKVKLTAEETAKLNKIKAEEVAIIKKLVPSIDFENRSLAAQAAIINQIAKLKGKSTQATLEEARFNREVALAQLTNLADLQARAAAVGKTDTKAFKDRAAAIEEWQAKFEIAEAIIKKGGKVFADTASKLKLPKIRLDIDDKKKPKLNISLDEFNQALFEARRAYGVAKTDIEGNPVKTEFVVVNLKRQTDLLKETASTLKLVGVSANKAGTFLSGFAKLAENQAESIRRTAAVTDRNFQVLIARTISALEEEIKLTEEAEQEKIDQIKKGFDDQIEALRAAEAEKLGIMEGSLAQKLLMQDKEFEAAKKKKEEEFLAFVEAETLKFEFEKELILQKAADKEQRQLAEAILDNDFKEFMEAQQKAHEDSLLQLAKDFAAKKKSTETQSADNEKLISTNTKDEIEALTKAKNDALTKAEEEKNKKLEELEKNKQDTEKALRKKQAEAQWQAEVAALESTKATKVAQTIASGLAGAAQAFAALAPIPFIGPALGAAASGAILAATFQSAAQIASQQAIKPAELFLERGGVLGGDLPHSRGGIKAELESGEAVIDKDRTTRLFNAIDSGIIGRNINVSFEPGAIVNNGENLLSEEFMDMIGDKFAERLERQGVFR